MNILNSPSSTINQVIAWLETKKPHYLAYSMVPLFFEISIKEGVDPTVSIAQAMKETGYFKFTGVLRPNFCNTCGLKVAQGGGDLDPNAHNRFEYWEHGILGHVEHLALYAGAKGYPKANPMDTRHFPYLLGKCPQVEDLSGNWAPGLTYGQDIVKMCNEIINTKTVNEVIEHICPELPDHECVIPPDHECPKPPDHECVIPPDHECPQPPEHICPDPPDHECVIPPDHVCPENPNDICNQLIDDILSIDPDILYIDMRVTGNGKSSGKVFRIQ